MVRHGATLTGMADEFPDENEKRGRRTSAAPLIPLSLPSRQPRAYRDR
jgi:hypothetical protein